MKPSPQLVFAWVLICLGYLVVLGGPAFALSRSGYISGAPWIIRGKGEDLIYHYGPTESDLVVSSISFVAAGIFMVFAGVFFRQRSLRRP